MICLKPISTSSSSAICHQYSTRLQSRTSSCTIRAPHRRRPRCAFCLPCLPVILSCGPMPPHVSRVMFLGHLRLSTAGDCEDSRKEHSGSKDLCLSSISCHPLCYNWTLVPWGCTQHVPSVPPSPFPHLFPCSSLLSPKLPTTTTSTSTDNDAHTLPSFSHSTFKHLTLRKVVLIDKIRQEWHIYFNDPAKSYQLMELPQSTGTRVQDQVMPPWERPPWWMTRVCPEPIRRVVENM